MNKRFDSGAFKIALIYLLVGCVWIISTDKFVASFTTDSTLIIRLECLKGWFYVLLTGILLYFLIQHNNKSMYDLAFHDSLTKLPNRRSFTHELNLLLEKAKKDKSMFAVLFVDLDRFKSINDTFGHDFGDLLLRSVSMRLRDSVRRDDLIARLGGDELAILLPNISDKSDVQIVAEEILESLNESILIKEQELYISPSIGIAFYPTHGEDAPTLLKYADMAMYHGKRQGGGSYYFYDNAMETCSIEHIKLENKLHEALKRDQFQLVYQPKVNLKTGQMSGVEALVRWYHPEIGIVLPGKFIPVAEDCGVIVPLGEWILRSACNQNRKWQENGITPFRVSVNVSAKQIKEPNFVEMVMNVLHETSLDAKWLELEITESNIMNDTDCTIDKLNRLRSFGIEISIDDFGTGYSSLNRLKKLPVDTLKIDQSFIRYTPFHEDDLAIANAIISFARALNLKVIAEGVETEEQLAFLCEKNCDEGQGYLFGEPTLATEIEKMIESNHLDVVWQDLSRL